MSTLPDDTKLGKYLIVRHLGSGGMADVYEAEDSQLGRRVALKVLPPELARNPQFIQRFESEVRKAASLNHGGIVPVFDFGFDNGTHYYSMRLLTHGSLRNRIDEGMTDSEALSILRDIADALGHAHGRQPPLVHRDVKPENILFDEQGRALLTDFGIAKAMDGNHSLTATGVAIGSALYMSPEQARGKKDVDGRADLYSLGAMFYEMLMGVPPYEGEDQISIILKHVTEPIPQLPEKFAQYQSLLDTMMAKNPAQRVATARDLVGLTDALLPPRPTRSTPGARTTGQTQTAAFLVGNGPDAALLADQQRQRDELQAQSQRDAEAARVRAESAAREAEAEALNKLLEAQRLEREKAAAQLAAEQQRQREEREVAARRAAEAEAERARVEADARQKAEAAARQQRVEAERLDAERIAREKAEAQAAEQQRIDDAKAEAARKADGARVRAEALAKQQAEAARLEREQEEARKAADQQRIRDEQTQVAHKLVDDRRRAEVEARRQAEAEARRLEAEAEARFEQEMAAALEAEQQRANAEVQAKQKAEAARLEREKAATAARIEQQRLQDEREAAARKAAEEQARTDALAKRKADEEAARQKQAELQRKEREQARSHNDDATVIRPLPAAAAPRPPAVAMPPEALPPTVGVDLRAPKRTSAEARSPASGSTTTSSGAPAKPGAGFPGDLPRKPMLIAAGVLALAVVAGIALRGGGSGAKQRIEAALANPSETLPDATAELLGQLDDAERTPLLAPGGAVERYFLSRSQAAFSAEPMSDDRVAALTMLRKANQTLFPQPSQALSERVDALSEPLYQLLKSVEGKTLFSMSPEAPSVLLVLRQLVLAGDEKRLERPFRDDLLRKFDSALATAAKNDLPGFERLLGDIEIVYGADPARRDALKARLDDVGAGGTTAPPADSADGDKAVMAAEPIVEAALTARKLDDARAEVLKLRKAGKLGSDRGMALADKVARKYAEQARADIESASILKESSAAFELKAAALASVRQLSPRIDISALQTQQRAKAELIVGRELADQILDGTAPAGDQAVQAGINLDIARGQLEAAPKTEREPLKARLNKALDKLRGPGVAAPSSTPTAPSVASSSTDPCAGQKSCTDSVGGQPLRSYRLGAAAPYDHIFLQEQEVSGDLYSIVMGSGMTAAPRLPVTGISADDAKRFAEKLSTQTRHKFRLPTAAEWQLAAKEIRPNVLATANCANDGGRLNNVEKPIGQAKGAVNIIGNAAEIVADGAGYRVAGASFRDAGADCSPDSLKPYAGPDAATGFRLVRVVE